MVHPDHSPDLAASSLWTQDGNSDVESFFFQAVKRNGLPVSASIFNTIGIPTQKTCSRLTDFSRNPSCRDRRECPPGQ